MFIDIFFQGTVEKPESWLDGLNQTTGEIGTFPGTYLGFVRREPVNKAPRPTPRPRPAPRPDIVKKAAEADDSGYGSSPQGNASFYVVRVKSWKIQITVGL